MIWRDSNTAGSHAQKNYSQTLEISFASILFVFAISLFAIISTNKNLFQSQFTLPPPFSSLPSNQHPQNSIPLTPQGNNKAKQCLTNASNIKMGITCLASFPSSRWERIFRRSSVDYMKCLNYRPNLSHTQTIKHLFAYTTLHIVSFRRVL